jgi:uncharacterized cupin superfamily protein
MTDGMSFTRLNPDSGERFQTLRQELDVTTFGMNLITLHAGQRGRIHRHARQEEVFVVLEGTLDLVTPETTHELTTGDCVRVAPDLRRQLVNRGPGRLVLIAIGSANEHAGRDGTAYADWDDTVGGAPQEMPNPDDLPAGDLRA